MHRTRTRPVRGLDAPPPRLTWQAAALIALALAVPGGVMVQVLWG